MTSLPEERLRSRMTRRNRSNSGPIGTIRVSSTPFLQPVGDPAQAVDRLGERLELLACLADQVELILDRAEVVAEPADVNRPAVKRATRPNRS